MSSRCIISYLTNLLELRRPCVACMPSVAKLWSMRRRAWSWCKVWQERPQSKFPQLLLWTLSGRILKRLSGLSAAVQTFLNKFKAASQAHSAHPRFQRPSLIAKSSSARLTLPRPRLSKAHILITIPSVTGPGWHWWTRPGSLGWRSTKQPRLLRSSPPSTELLPKQFATSGQGTRGLGKPSHSTAGHDFWNPRLRVRQALQCQARGLQERCRVNSSSTSDTS